MFYSAITGWARADRACSHTYKLPIIYPDTETDREKERETRIVRRTYTRTISYNITEQSERYSDITRDKHGSRDVHTHLQ